jgi:hypothetical protein
MACIFSQRTLDNIFVQQHSAPPPLPTTAPYQVTVNREGAVRGEDHPARNSDQTGRTLRLNPGSYACVRIMVPTYGISYTYVRV